MRKLFLVALLAFGTIFALTISPVEASTNTFTITFPSPTTLSPPKRLKSENIASASRPPFRRSAHTRNMPINMRQEADAAARSGSVSLAGVTPVLAAKAREIASSCGSSVISAVSRRGNRSNHPIGRAVDMRGNPSCIYAHLKGGRAATRPTIAQPVTSTSATIPVDRSGACASPTAATATARPASPARGRGASTASPARTMSTPARTMLTVRTISGVSGAARRAAARRGRCSHRSLRCRCIARSKRRSMLRS